MIVKHPSRIVIYTNSSGVTLVVLYDRHNVVGTIYMLVLMLIGKKTLYLSYNVNKVFIIWRVNS